MTKEKEEDILRERFKVILIGDGKTGKTSIKNVYLGLDFIDKYSMTLGVDYSIKETNKFLLQIWDIGGQRIYENVVEEYFKNTQAAVLVYDITNRDTFHNINRWVRLLSQQVGYMVPAVLVGNKSDLRTEITEEVSVEEGNNMARKLSNNSIFEIPYIETSAKMGLNIDYIFEYLLATLIDLHYSHLEV